MPTLVVLATSDDRLSEAWERQVSSGRTLFRLGRQDFPVTTVSGIAAVVILDTGADALLPSLFVRCPTILIGEPGSVPFVQARLEGRARVYLSYEESTTRLGEFLPLMEELAEKQSMLDLLVEKSKRAELVRPVAKIVPGGVADTAEMWDFVEGAVENLDTRDRLITEFRRASRHILHASHAVFFLREADGFRADRGTSHFRLDDPLVAFFENHPVVIDGTIWEHGVDPVAEMAVRNRLALWGARLLVPIHDNARLLGLLALGVRDDGQPYNEADRARAVFFARLLRHCLEKSIQLGRLSALTDQVTLGSKYLPNTIVLSADENPPRHIPLLVRELIGRARKTREVCRVSPSDGQPFRAGAGLVLETGGVWAFWEEVSAEVHDTNLRQRAGRRGLLHDIALTLSHELGNALVSLATLRHLTSDRPPPSSLLDTARADVGKLEALNRELGLMQRLYEADAVQVDLRELAGTVGAALSLEVEVGPDPVPLIVSKDLIEFALQSIVEVVAENRPTQGVRELTMQVRSSGTGSELTALVSIKGRHLELEGVFPEPAEGAVPNQGRLRVFLAKEILRLHHGGIHAGPGIEGTEILISIRNL